MIITNCNLWSSDIDEIIATLPELYDFEGKSVLITGCTGLVCSALIDTLIRWNKTHDTKIRIRAAGRSEKKALSRFPDIINEDWFTFVPYDAVSAKTEFDFCVDYIIHGASNASPAKYVKEPVETMLSNFLGMKSLLDYAKEKETERVLYISSSEVYGKKESNQPFHTDEYGYIDLLNPRNSYSVAKRATETLCASYTDEYGVESVIIRPGHIYGPTASVTDNRVSSAWAYAAARGEDIVMKSDGSQLRSYCYCLDCAAAILMALLKGESGHAYNVSNPNSVISIRDMAEILAQSAGVKLRIDIPTSDEIKSFNPMSNSSLDSTDLLDLGWKGMFDAKRGFSHTVSILKDIIC